MMQRLPIILTIILLSQWALGQCPGSLSCEGAQTHCEIRNLNGFTCSNPDFPNTAFPLGSLCNGAGVPHNLNWWAFVGAGGPLNLQFNFDPANCDDGLGIQAGVFEGNCAGTRIWDCNAGCNTSTFVLSGATVACEVYYVWVDGCNGDVCTYTISITGNTGRPNLQRPIPRPVANPPVPCLCGTTEVCFPGFMNGCEATLTWTVDGQPAGMQGDMCIEVDFPTPARRQICLYATIGNPNDPSAICDQDFVCIDVAPAPPETRIGPLTLLCPKRFPFDWHGMPITTDCITPPCSVRVEAADGCCVDSLRPFKLLPKDQKLDPVPRIICFEDQPVDWHGMTISTSCINPPCITEIEGPDGCLFDSLAIFQLLPMRREGRVDTFFCSAPPTGPVYRAENNRVYSEDQCGELITFQDPVFGCDTSYALNLRYFKYRKDWQLDCYPCDGAVTLCPNIEYDPDCPEFDDGSVQIELQWTGPNGMDLGTTIGTGCMRFTLPGTVTVRVNVTYRGKKCPSVNIETYNIPATLFPGDPTIDGDSSVCGSTPARYFFENPPMNICEYNWTIKRGGGRIINNNAIDTNVIMVDWSNSSGSFGEVCLSFKTDCGVSGDTCFLVDFSGSPQISAGPDTNICAMAYTMLGIPDVGNGQWRQVSGPDMATIDAPTNPNTDVSVNGYGIYKFVYSESENDCETIDTVTIGFRPNPEPTNLDTICGSEAVNFVVSWEIVNGTGPYTITQGGGSVTGNIYKSDTILDNTPTTIVLQDSFGCEMVFFIDHDCICGNMVGEVSADTLEFCGPDEVACVDYDDTNQEFVEGVDTVMYILYSMVGNVRNSEILRNQSGCFVFDPSSMSLDQVYYIAAVVGRKDNSGFVDYDGGCLKIDEGQPVIWHTIPSPMAGNDIEICGQVTNLEGVLDLGTTSYRWLNSPGLKITDPNDLNSEVTLQSGYGEYEVVLEEVNAGCTGLDTVNITFFEIPESVDAREICVDSISRASFNYIVCFKIEKGTPPYMIVQGGGSIDANGKYCSDELQSLETYDIIIRDANGCEFRLTGDHNCDCGNSDPGTMDQSSLNVCVDECVDIASNGTEVLQADEEAEFVLHEGSGAIVVNEIERISYDHTAIPAEVVQFCFDANKGMIAGRVYYISRLIHEKNTADDPCERLAPGTPVIWHNYPNADAGSGKDICGLTTDIASLPSIGIGEWSIVNRPVGSNVVLSPNMASQIITVDQYGTYTLQWKEDNNGCADSAQMSITFHDAPVLSDVSFECDSVAESYRIRITLSGGDDATYDITGVNTSPLGNGVFLSEWIPTGDGFSLCADDQWNCLPACLDSTIECTCITEAGSITGNETACLDQCIDVTYQGGTLDPNDIVSYVLHDGDATTVGTILDCNVTGNMCFDAQSMTPNQTYYVAGMVGNDGGNGCVNSSDRCVQYTTGIPVTWYEYPSPDIASTVQTFTCDIDSLQLTGSNTNGLPGNLTYSWGSIDGAICSSSNLSSSNVFVCSSGSYVLTITHDESGCSTMDTITIDRDADLPMVVSGNSQEITCDRPIVTLDATGSDFGGNFVLNWYDARGTLIGNGLTVQVSSPGKYTVEVVNQSTDCVDSKEVEVTENTTPPEAVIDQLGELNCTTSSIEIEAVNSVTQGGIRSYQWSTVNGDIEGSSSVAKVTITSPGDYQVIIIDDENGCADTTEISVIEIGNTLEALQVSSEGPTCYGYTDAMIDISINGGVPPLQYSINNGPFTTSNIFNNLGPGTYDVTVKDNDGCTKDTTITITEPAEITISAKNDMVKEAGSSIFLDTLVDFVTGIQRDDADNEWWINVETGDTLNRLVIDSLKETTTFRVVIEKNGCTSSDIITIFVKYTRKVYVPNVIIPGSGVGDNNTLYVFGNANRLDRVNFMRIYDRWGELIYNGENLDFDEQLGRTTEGWDGTFNGELVNPGVYVYHIEVAFLSGNGSNVTQQFYGDITLLR